MDTALPQKFPFILDRNLAKENCTENRVCTSCDTVALGRSLTWYNIIYYNMAYNIVIQYNIKYISGSLQVLTRPNIMKCSSSYVSKRSSV